MPGFVVPRGGDGDGGGGDGAGRRQITNGGDGDGGGGEGDGGGGSECTTGGQIPPLSAAETTSNIVLPVGVVRPRSASAQ